MQHCRHGSGSTGVRNQEAESGSPATAETYRTSRHLSAQHPLIELNVLFQVADCTKITLESPEQQLSSSPYLNAFSQQGRVGDAAARHPQTTRYPDCIGHLVATFLLSTQSWGRGGL